MFLDKLQLLYFCVFILEIQIFNKNKMSKHSISMYYPDQTDERRVNTRRNMQVIAENILPRESDYHNSYPSSYTSNWRLSANQEKNPQSMDGGSVNQGFEKATEGYSIYRGKEEFPITFPPEALGDDSIVMRNQKLTKSFFSNESTGIPTDEIELQAFGRRSYCGSLAVEDLRNSHFDQRHLHEGKEVHGLNTLSTVSEHEFAISKRERALGLNLLKFFTIIVIIWDIIADWMVVWKFDNHTCYRNFKIVETFLMDGTMCGANREKMCQVFSVVAVLGSIIGALQIVNIILDMMYHWGLSNFRLSHAQYDLYISLYFEEIPQAIILVIFNYSCTCDAQGRTLSLMAMVSGLASCFFRYGTSFRSLRGNRGCCNTWWRCCCCRQHEYLCHCAVQDCFCKCDIPCPLLCCTLRCDSCQWTTNTWCARWMHMFSCFCNCCSEDKTMFGVRVMNSLGAIFLMACTVAMGLLWSFIPTAA